MERNKKKKLKGKKNWKARKRTKTNINPNKYISNTFPMHDCEIVLWLWCFVCAFIYSYIHIRIKCVSSANAFSFSKVHALYPKSHWMYMWCGLYVIYIIPTYTPQIADPLYIYVQLKSNSNQNKYNMYAICLFSIIYIMYIYIPEL